jgi:hypothetical protein
MPYKWQIVAEVRDEIAKLPIWLQEIIYDELDEIASRAPERTSEQSILQFISESRGGMRHNVVVGVAVDHSSKLITVLEVVGEQIADLGTGSNS